MVTMYSTLPIYWATVLMTMGVCASCAHVLREHQENVSNSFEGDLDFGVQMCTNMLWL